MTYTLYGSAIALCTRRVAIIFKEKGVDFDFVHVNLLKGEQKTPEFLENGQPFGKIPYMVEDDNFKLFESRAMSRYIATKYANQGTKGLIPTELKANALFEQAASIEVEYFDVAAMPIFKELAKVVFFKQQPDAAKLDEGVKNLETQLDVYEKLLSKAKYLGGDEITLADLFHLPLGSWLTVNGVHLLLQEKRPNVARWWKDITDRPSWKTVSEWA